MLNFRTKVFQFEINLFEIIKSNWNKRVSEHLHDTFTLDAGELCLTTNNNKLFNYECGLVLRLSLCFIKLKKKLTSRERKTVCSNNNAKEEIIFIFTNFLDFSWVEKVRHTKWIRKMFVSQRLKNNWTETHRTMLVHRLNFQKRIHHKLSERKANSGWSERIATSNRIKRYSSRCETTE